MTGEQSMAHEKLEALADGLNGVVTDEGKVLSTELTTEDVEMLKVDIQDREEYPAFITVDQEQILCVTYLWREAGVRPETRAELLKAMLLMNLPMPLSSFGKVGDQYLIFGAMAAATSVAEVQHELCVLSDNTLSAIEAMGDYLQ